MTGAAKNILLVDDDTDLQFLVKTTLSCSGFCVETANNGLEALTRLSSFQPDLIVLDLNMPQMGGLEFCRRILDETGRLRYQVLIFTARANVENISQTFPISGFMSKPFEIDDLLREVNRITAAKA